MNDNIIKVFIFAAGAAVGSAVTWKLVKSKYEQIANEEIESVKEVFSRREAAIKKEDENEEENIAEPKEVKNKVIPDKEGLSVVEYAKILAKQNYSNEKEEKENEGGSEDMDQNDIYVIPPEEFGDDPDYEVVSLTYYNDDILTDEFDDVITEDEIDELIGDDALTRFGEYEDDSVFVKNELKETYYEILRDTRNYSDVI